MKKVKKISTLSFYLWGFCVLGFSLAAIYIVVYKDSLFNEVKDISPLIGIAFLGLGGLFFLLGTFSLSWFRLDQKNDRISIKSGFLAFILEPFFPLYFVYSTLKKEFRSRIKKIFSLIVGTFFFLPIWALGYFLTYRVSLEFLGLGSEFAMVMSSDSMAPTIPGGSGFKYYRYKNIWYRLDNERKYEFKRGDIISFSTPKTRELIASFGKEDYNFYKRIIALPGDTVDIKGGSVFLNGEPLYEPYTLKENNTYINDYVDEDGNVLAEAFMKPCEKIVVPEDSLFVLGDNREHSDDSRIIGFVDFDSVKGYLPYEEQQQEYYHGVNYFDHDKDWRPSEGSVEIENLDIKCNK